MTEDVMVPSFEAWMDREWPLWRNDAGSLRVAQWRNVWNAALAAAPAGGGDDYEQGYAAGMFDAHKHGTPAALAPHKHDGPCWRNSHADCGC